MRKTMSSIRLRVILSVSIIALFFVVYSQLYLPMKSELEFGKCENLYEIGRLNFQYIKNNMDRSIDGAVSVSSQTSLRDPVVAFNKGQISLNEAARLTESEYKESVRSLRYAVYAERTALGKTIVNYGNAEQYSALRALCGQKVLDHHILQHGDQLILLVHSPVVYKGQVLARDTIVFDLTGIVYAIARQDKVTGLIPKSEEDQYPPSSVEVLGSYHDRLIRDEAYVYYFGELDSEWLFQYKVAEKNLFADINQLSARIVMRWGTISLGLILLMYFFAVKSLRITEMSRDEYRDRVFSDALTGAYSRAFLDAWKREWNSVRNRKTLVMVDINDFKHINDAHGHHIGDQVLMALAKTIRKYIISADCFIRVGGDEFLILLEERQGLDVSGLISRIQKDLSENQPHPFSISLAYGYSIMDRITDFDTAYQVADKAMYAHKLTKTKKEPMFSGQVQID